MKQVKNLLLFLDQSLGELKKVHWPDKRELLISFIATMCIVLFFSFFLAFVDGMIGTAIKKIIFWIG